MPVQHRDYPNYLLNILEDDLTYAHLGDCGEWDKHGGDGSIPIEWRCGPSAAPCDNEATGEPDCLVGQLVCPPEEGWKDFENGGSFCPADMDGGDGPFSPFIAYYVPGQPDSATWDAVIDESEGCAETCVGYGGSIECGGVPGNVPAPEPHPPFYFGYDHDFFPGYIRIFPIGPFVSWEECTPAAQTPAPPDDDNPQVCCYIPGQGYQLKNSVAECAAAGGESRPAGECEGET